MGSRRQETTDCSPGHGVAVSAALRNSGCADGSTPTLRPPETMLDQGIQSTLCRPLTPHTPPGAVIARYLATSFAIWILTGDANNCLANQPATASQLATRPFPQWLRLKLMLPPKVLRKSPPRRGGAKRRGWSVRDTTTHPRACRPLPLRGGDSPAIFFLTSHPASQRCWVLLSESL